MAQGDDVGEPDLLNSRPFQDRRQHRPFGRDQGQMARLGKNVAEGGVQAPARRNDAEAARSQQAQTLRPGDFAPGSRFVGGTGAGGDGDDSGSSLPQFSQQAGERSGRRGDNGQFRSVRQIGQALAGRHVLYARMATVNQEQFAFESAGQQVTGQRRADGAGPLAGADQRHRSGFTQRS